MASASNDPLPPSHPLKAQTMPAPGPPEEPHGPTLSNRGRTATEGTMASISSASSRLRSASLRLLDVDLPPGMWAATANTTAAAPTLGDIRQGGFGPQGWDEAGQIGDRERRARRRSSGSAGAGRGKRRRSSAKEDAGQFPPLQEADTAHLSAIPSAAPEAQTAPETTKESPKSHVEGADAISSTAPISRSSTKSSPDEKVSSTLTASSTPPPYVVREDGYIEPPKVPWTTSTVIGLKGFWRWFLTIPGFLITLYGLNVVAWGGMLFLLLCNASPAMCHLADGRTDCNDINSPRRIWLEIDSQILNALFCVTGFGLIPWRFRDWFWLLRYRIGLCGRSKEKRMEGLRRLAGIHRGWFRLPGSDRLGKEDVWEEADINALPIPVEKRPDPPLTGVRAPPTRLWKMDFVIWCNVWNTFLQACLCGFMWGMNRYNRPSWVTGFFIAFACVVAGMGGIMMFLEGKKVKRVEGVPPKELSDQQRRKIENDVENGRLEPQGSVLKEVPQRERERGVQ